MGIHGLLPQLKSIMAPIHVEELRGRKVAVDTYSWLHRGALSCAANLCKGLPTSKHIEYCMHRVNLLRHYGVEPILVFDGGLLPMKSDQEMKRAKARKENLERAMEHEVSGNSTAALECYQKAVDITPSIAYELIQVLRKEKVDYIVAPYEADAQMTYLSINKHVDAVITEDSDLIPFGCSRIIFKMDKFGQGVDFQSSTLEKNKELDLTGFSKTMLLEMCIFSGCDYLQSLPGMGLKRAHALVRKFKTYEKVIKHLRYSSISVPPSYEDSFKRAMWAFQHQRVYDPVKEDIVHLSDISHDLGHDVDFLGPWLPQQIVKGIAIGNLDPLSKMPFQVGDKFFSESDKAIGLSSYGKVNDSENYSSLLELKLDTASDKENNCYPLIKVVQKDGSSMKRKVVRSSYFQNEPLDRNGCENQSEESSVDKDDAEVSAYDCTTGKGASLGNDCHKGTIKKRKIINEASLLEDLRIKSSSDECDHFPNSTTKSENAGKGGNFGCDISHLKSYSGIAEKSMERFVSLMSSFRYTGSRASGLRAPLKDVENTCSHRRSASAPIKYRRHSLTRND